MAKFVLMFHGGPTPEEPSPAVMDRWMAWFGELGEAVVDMGAPFGAAATVGGSLLGNQGEGWIDFVRAGRSGGRQSSGQHGKPGQHVPAG